MKIAMALLACSLTGWHGVTQANPDELAPGQALYESKCLKCHSVSTNEVGPRHQNVVGRRAGSVPDFVYSTALKQSKVVWTEEMLDRWLSNPEALIPGQEMDVRVRSAEERRLLIAYLKSQSTSTSPPSLTSKH
ncbi:c-type cytochrome [Aquabacterium sp.]|uniref:c-type cytochrome n=1 Tax=Aquabacterium sp. TaxID=1872578 RepID=UPI002487D65A|nr:c-type cytochrome [Aquabacterium sp.]MDI1260019.1 c-type cytochrome [Aquabacterium sp.]